MRWLRLGFLRWCDVGRIEVAPCMAGHSNAKTNGLYDRRNGDQRGEVERIGIGNGSL
jgi:hypothetical protein